MATRDDGYVAWGGLGLSIFIGVAGGGRIRDSRPQVTQSAFPPLPVSWVDPLRNLHFRKVNLMLGYIFDRYMELASTESRV